MVTPIAGISTRELLLLLSLNDGSRTVVARSHRATLGIIGRRREATLEISPAVAHMMDIVIMTFIYVETIRMKKERSSRNAGGGAMSGAMGGVAGGVC
ncbi:hypothetical protein AZE42_13282 [Rhizopogon vesiculosus]|uniref:DUF6593 domain-containing protein n=1 Tax=Rhizopogon vesiculosus TaxID=180088 RepID=A0A1J8QHR6_9AGAM|nr:hypothetical protein AZE42_13282 [Rhizopogon vesiculosus]